MADLSNYLEDAFANSLRGGTNGSSFTAPTAVYVQLHTGTPGEAGTSNVSAETDRVAIEFGAASGGVITSSNSPEWASWDAGAETISDISLWDASSGGNCLATGDLTSSRAVADGDTFRLPAGDVTITIA